MAPPEMSPPVRLGFHSARGFGVAGAAGEDGVAEARSETFYLRFDDYGAVDDGAGGDVAVSPGGVLSFGCAGGVEEAGLDEKNVGAVVEAAVEGVVLGVRDFSERARRGGRWRRGSTRVSARGWAG